MSEMLPCPWEGCGSTPVVDRSADVGTCYHVTVCCEGCGMRAPSDTNDEGAVENWNTIVQALRRPPDAAGANLAAICHAFERWYCYEIDIDGPSAATMTAFKSRVEQETSAKMQPAVEAEAGATPTVEECEWAFAQELRASDGKPLQRPDLSRSDRRGIAAVRALLLHPRVEVETKAIEELPKTDAIKRCLDFADNESELDANEAWGQLGDLLMCIGRLRALTAARRAEGGEHVRP